MSTHSFFLFVGLLVCFYGHYWNGKDAPYTGVTYRTYRVWGVGQGDVQPAGEALSSLGSTRLSF